MLVFSLMPLVEDGFKPNAQDFEVLTGGSLSALLFEPVPLKPTWPESGFSVLPLSPGLHLLMHREEETESHPTEILAITLDLLRNGHPLTQARGELDLSGLSGLSIPGQAHGTSGMRSHAAPSEGVVMVVSDVEDWARPVQPDAMSFADVLPALQRLWSDEPVSWSQPTRESVVTSDFRGLLLDVEDYEVHDETFLAAEETLASSINLAHGHALRSYDVAAAARLADRLILNLGRAEAVERKSLEAMRQVQLRFASRGLEAVIEHRRWEGTRADDAFRLRQRLRFINASLESMLSAAFERLQPLVEASEAARIQEQSDANAEQRRKDDEEARRGRATADEERRERQEQRREAEVRAEQERREKQERRREAEVRAEEELRQRQDAERAAEHAADVAAQTRADEVAARDERVAKLTRRGAGAVAGASVVVLFAALAAIPQGRALFSPYIRAAYATVVLGALVTATAWLMERAMHARTPRGWVRWLVGTVGWGLVLAALGVAGTGWLGLTEPELSTLAVVVAALVVGGGLALLVVDLDKRRVVETGAGARLRN